MTFTITNDQTSPGNKIEKRSKHIELRVKQAHALANIGCWEHDFSTGLSEWSEAVCNIYGLSPENNQHSYKSWASYIHPEDQPGVLEITKNAEETLTGFVINHRIVRPDGMIRHLLTKGMFELEDNGRPAYLYGIVQDITEAKEAEKERTKMVNEIVHRNKMLEQFTYIVSHNLRAPVANILGMTEVLQTPDMDDKDKAVFIKGLECAAQKLDNIVLDLNDILQIDTKTSNRKEPVIFSEMLDDIKASYRGLLQSERTKIIHDFSATDNITTLKSYLHSIFYNLISNSIKYRQSDIDPLIEISTALNDGSLHIVYKDNGIGIDMSKHGQNIFGLYKRFHTHIDGKGMGLFMVKTQVELLGGRINIISSEVNKGTEFLIEFDNEQI